jgi:ubiquitin-protein ligase
MRVFVIRLSRLYAEWQKMQLLDAQSTLIDIQSFGDPPERYLVTYHCKGLAWLDGHQEPSITNKHQLEIYLHQQFPHLPPRLTWLTEIFHPNILPPRKNSGVCIGAWTPAETLDRLCIRIGEMIEYRNFSVTDALDLDAARWASEHLHEFPIDDRDFLVRDGNNGQQILELNL